MISFTVINTNIGGGIYDDIRFMFVEHLLHRIYVADFDVLMSERDKFKMLENLTEVGS